MLALNNIADISLPDRTLCLTYDDGPGPASAEIGRFLKAQGVRATFFVVGKFAIDRPEVLQQLHEDGHIIGNHTFEHPDMPFYVSVNGDVRDQFIRTNTLISRYNRDKPIYVRATYGKWAPEVAKELNVDLRCSFRHVGPIYWDIPGVDCYFWKLGKSVDEAVQAYVDETTLRGKGVMVMHDSSADMETVAQKNQTLELTRRLIPLLQDKGYRFVGLDEIDDPQLLSPLEDSFALRGGNGRFLRCDADSEGASLSWSGSADKEGACQFTLEYKDAGKVALRGLGGRYLRVDPDVDDTVRLTSRFGEHALFDCIPVQAGCMMLRSHNGNYLAAEHAKGGLLKANAPYMRQAWVFTYMPRTHGYLKPLSGAQRIDRLRRRALFVKSKLLGA